MAELAKQRAEARRKKLLQNSESRMKKLLGDLHSEKINSNCSCCEAPQKETNILTAADTNANPFTNSHVDEEDTAIKSAKFTEAMKTFQAQNDDSRNKCEVSRPIKSSSNFLNSNSKCLIMQKKVSSVWIFLCIALAMLFSLYMSFCQEKNLSFINGYVAFLTIYLSYRICSDNCFVISDSFLMTATAMAVDTLKLPENTKIFLKLLFNFVFSSVEFFCLYSFFFFGVFKIFS